MPRTRLIRTGLNANAGTFFDGWRMTLHLTPTWYVSRHLELTGEYLYNRIRSPERNQQLDAHVARLRIGTALNTHLSANTFVQYNSAASSMSANVRFRYNFREGNDLWIVYNEGFHTDRHRVWPALPLTDARTVLIKYTHTFHL